MIRQINDSLDSLDNTVISFYDHKMMNLLLSQREGDPIKFAHLSRQLALTAEAKSEWYKARANWDNAIRWNKLAKRETERRDSLIALAETFVKESDDTITADAGPRYGVAAQHLRSAIEHFEKPVIQKSE